MKNLSFWFAVVLAAILGFAIVQTGFAYIRHSNPGELDVGEIKDQPQQPQQLPQVPPTPQEQLKAELRRETELLVASMGLRPIELLLIDPRGISRMVIQWAGVYNFFTSELPTDDSSQFC